MADMFTHLFIAESLIARNLQTLSEKESSRMTINIAKIYVTESLLDLRLMSSKCLHKIFPENIPTSIEEPVNSLIGKMTLKTDTITLKQSLGEFMFRQKDNPF